MDSCRHQGSRRQTVSGVLGGGAPLVKYSMSFSFRLSKLCLEANALPTHAGNVTANLNKPKLQDYTAIANYVSKEMWDSKRFPLIVYQLAAKLGLKNGSEQTMGHITALRLFHSGPEVAHAKSGQEFYDELQLTKRSYKKYRDQVDMEAWRLVLPTYPENHDPPSRLDFPVEEYYMFCADMPLRVTNIGCSGRMRAGHTIRSAMPSALVPSSSPSMEPMMQMCPYAGAVKCFSFIIQNYGFSYLLPI